MRAPEAGAKNFGIFWRRAVFLCIWKERLLKMWTFLLGWGVLEHPQHPPRYGPDLRLIRVDISWPLMAAVTSFGDYSPSSANSCPCYALSRQDFD